MQIIMDIVYHSLVVYSLLDYIVGSAMDTPLPVNSSDKGSTRSKVNTSPFVNISSIRRNTTPIWNTSTESARSSTVNTTPSTRRSIVNTRPTTRSFTRNTTPSSIVNTRPTTRSFTRNTTPGSITLSDSTERISSISNSSLISNTSVISNISSIANISSKVVNSTHLINQESDSSKSGNITSLANDIIKVNTDAILNTTFKSNPNRPSTSTIHESNSSTTPSSVSTSEDITSSTSRHASSVTEITEVTSTPQSSSISTDSTPQIQPTESNTTIPDIQGNVSTGARPPPLYADRRGRPDLRSINISSEQKLMTDLLWRYENSVRPVYNSSKSVVVKLGLTLTQILDLDEKNQVLTTNVWLEVEWFDEKLVWENSSYEGTKSIRIPCRQIWLPDIVLYNSVDDYTSGYMPSLAMVDSDGRVFWGPVVRFRSSCKIDITYFPFDDQVCHLKLGSWAYNGFQVDSIKRSDSIDLSNYIDNGEWELIGVKVTRNSVFYNCCKEPFPDVMFYMHLRRRVKYYFMNIIIPCIILSFLCLAGFLLPPESGEKITLGLSVLLTITVFMLMVADKMPQTSESISLISIYLMVVLSMSCLSILFSVGILSIHHQRGKPRRCPDVIKYFVFSIIAPMLCLKLRSYGHAVKRNVVREKPSRPKRSFPDKPEVIQLDGRCDMTEFEEEFETFMADPNLSDLDLDLRSFQEKQNSVNELIQWLHRKHRTETIEDLSFQEWRDVAFVLDRLLFVVFLIVTVVSTIGILSMRPEQMLTGFTDVHVER